jgi:hypothetical protein
VGAPTEVPSSDRAGGGTRARPPPRALPLVVLLIVAVVHVALVATVVRSNVALEHDEILSHLAASGHRDDWQRAVGGAAPTGRWASGGDLKRFLEIDSHSSLAQVASNLADLDIHPPLFFWSLLGVRTAGVAVIWSGPLLNVLAVAGAGALLFSLLAEALDDRLLASLAVAVFAFSPAVVRSVAYARQYPFLLLATVGLIWVTARLLRNPTSVALLVGLFAVGVLGLLTEPVFAFALAGAALTITVRWLPRHRRPIALAFVALLGSGLVALAIFHGYFDQYSRASTIPNTTTLRQRARQWAEGFFDFVTLDHSARPVLDVVALVGGLTLLATVKVWYRSALGAIRDRPAIAAAVGVGGTALVGASFAYLSGRTPPHAAGWQYFIWFWPAIVVVGAAMLRHRSWGRSALALGVVAVLLVTFSWRWERSNNYLRTGQRHAVAEVAHATLVVADCLEGGTTPGAAMWVRRHAQFLLLAPGAAVPPPIPRGADVTRPLLFQGKVPFQGNSCVPRVANLDQALARLGFVRGARIGPIGFIDVYQLDPR